MKDTFSGICESLGAPVKSVRWSWCALSSDGKRAVFTLWQDACQGRRYPIVYHGDRRKSDNANRPGWTGLTDVVEHCLANPDTEALGVLCKAKDPAADPREREWVEGNELLVLRIERDQHGVPWAQIAGRRRR